MPLYEYQCKCGNIQEEIREIADRDRPAICDKCGKAMKKVLVPYVIGKPSYQMKVWNSKKQTIGVGREPKGWRRP